MSFIQIKGNNYECGYQLGQFFKSNISFRLKRAGIDDHLVQKLKTILKKVHHLHLVTYKKYIEEIKGMADGSGQDYWKLFLLNCPHITEATHGCTSVAFKDRGKFVLAHNEDGVNGDRIKDAILVEFIQPDVRFHSFVYAGELAGSAYSWNDHGLYFTVNYVPSVEKYTLLLSRFFTARSLIETSSVKKAILLISRRGHARGYHYFLGKKNELYSVEQFQNKTSVIPIKDTFIHTNHYVHKMFSEIRLGSKNSKIRYSRVASLFEAKEKPIDILFSTEDKTDSIYGTTDTIRTLSTIFFRPQEGKIIVYSKNEPKDNLVFTF